MYTLKIANDFGRLRIHCHNDDAEAFLSRHWTALSEGRRLFFGPDPQGSACCRKYLAGTAYQHAVEIWPMQADFPVFGPYEVELSPNDHDEFELELPPAHELPWLRLQYKHTPAQILALVTARIKSAIEAGVPFPTPPYDVRKHFTGEVHSAIKELLHGTQGHQSKGRARRP